MHKPFTLNHVCELALWQEQAVEAINRNKRSRHLSSTTYSLKPHYPTSSFEVPTGSNNNLPKISTNQKSQHGRTQYQNENKLNDSCYQ